MRKDGGKKAADMEGKLTVWEEEEEEGGENWGRLPLRNEEDFATEGRSLGNSVVEG